MSQDTVRLSCADNTIERVACLARFHMEIDGKRIAFAVTPKQGKQSTENVTHVASGMRVCAVTLAVTFANMRTETLEERGRQGVEMLIDKFGAARVRAVMESAQELPALTEAA